jgi:hypothetical protein
MRVCPCSERRQREGRREAGSGESPRLAVKRAVAGGDRSDSRSGDAPAHRRPHSTNACQQGTSRAPTRAPVRGRVCDPPKRCSSSRFLLEVAARAAGPEPAAAARLRLTGLLALPFCFASWPRPLRRESISGCCTTAGPSGADLNWAVPALETCTLVALTVVLPVVAATETWRALVNRRAS